MTDTAPAPDSDITISYPAMGVPCDACGRPAFEFAHLPNGEVHCRHRYMLAKPHLVKGRPLNAIEWTCRIR